MSIDEKTVRRAAGRRATPGRPSRASMELEMETLEHELRTPLTSIRLLLEIMRDCPDLAEEQRRRFVDALLADEARLARAVEHLLESPVFTCRAG